MLLQSCRDNFQCFFDIDVCIDLCEYYADVAPDRVAQDESLALPDADFSSRICASPVGVVAAITPWNYPLMQAVVKVAPALAVGCSVVLKPSPLASLTCLELGKMAGAIGPMAMPGFSSMLDILPPEFQAILASPGLISQLEVDDDADDAGSGQHPCAREVSACTHTGGRQRTVVEAGSAARRPIHEGGRGRAAEH